MALHIGQYGDVLTTLHLDVPKTSYFNILRTPVEEVGRGSPLALNRGLYGGIHRTSSDRNFAEWVTGFN